ncbi:hypothetical protein [Dyella sp. C9]|uniref:hypothetical protein n=1 Tax=Dyella sp. C9 TaxID=2202154 RepID=UPI000DEEF119|nr:hypothetical protein [Dyella sp. C9]
MLHDLICELESDHSLEQPERLRERVDAMERLEDVLAHAQEADGTPLLRRARTLHEKLADVQHRLCEAIRQAIVLGGGRQALDGWATPCARPAPLGYDHLDALVSEVLCFDEPGATGSPATDMVFYQPTPARHVFDLLDRARLGREDILVDLGSGLGHVPMLTTIHCGARAIGVEYEDAYVRSARHSARALKLDRVDFLAQDAREADLSAGTLFYLYTPFGGGMLRDMLARLQQESRRRPIRIATLGPCTATVAGEPWLRAQGPVEADRISLFRACSS